MPTLACGSAAAEFFVSLLRPAVADFSAAVSPLYLATHALKVVGGAFGGWLAARKRVAPASVF